MEKNCPICNSSNKIIIIERNVTPYCNRLYERKEEAVNVPHIPMKLCLCTNCGMVYNSMFDDRINLYSEGYNNSQFSSEIFEKYIDDCIDTICLEVGEKDNATFLEIGCGLNGSFLKKLAGRYHGACLGIGYDPAYCGEETVSVRNNGKCRFIRQYFTGSIENNQDIDLIISRHCIEHMSNPWIMLDALKTRCGGAYIETPDVRWSLKNIKWFDFGYEHCSLFSPVVFKWIANQKGFHIKEIKHTFHNQYMQVIFDKENTKNVQMQMLKDEIRKNVALVNVYKVKEKEILNEFRSMIKKYKRLGKIAIWGGGGKGNVFLNLVDAAGMLIDAVIDINPEKQGKYIAGTGHEIIVPGKISTYDIKTILIMNENYKEEIENKLESMGLNDINIRVL